MVCPVCRGDSILLRRLRAQDIARELAEHLGTPPQGLGGTDYEEYRCSRCNLEFAAPPVPGSDVFYGWATQHPGYYPDGRWEWDYVLGVLRVQLMASVRGLDVGCGTGAFITRALSLGNCHMTGVDSTPSVVVGLRQRGLDAHCMTIDSFAAMPGNAGSFDVVTAFQCLEHVPDPCGFVSSALRCLREGGRAFVSTPYSPTALECHVWDPLNHPPHHLTRWNTKSLAMLADAVGASVQFHMPRPVRAIWRVLFALRAMRSGKPAGPDPHPIGTLLRNPWRTLTWWREQRAREHVQGYGVAPSDILAEFQRLPGRNA